MTTTTRQLTDLERAVRRARHVVRNPVANPALDAKHVAPLVVEFDRREDEIGRLTAELEYAREARIRSPLDLVAGGSETGGN